MAKTQDALTNLGSQLGTGSSFSYNKLFSKILLYLPLILWTIFTIFPFWYMLVVSTRTNSEIFRFPPPLWFGHGLKENYDILFTKLSYWRNLWNSFYIAVMATITTLFFCSLGGYGFSMYNFKGKQPLFQIMMATMMIPAMVGIIPFFILISRFGWINQPRALYLPGAANAFGIYLMRQYIISSVPYELMDAARIDGCNEFSIYYRIILPIIKPGLGALGIITFLGQWNSFMTPLIILRDKLTYTYPVALRSFQGAAQTQWGAIYLGSTISILPIVIVFVIMNRQIISGLTAGSVKG